MRRLRVFSPRPMREADLKVVGAIERAACAFPWTEGTFVDCLQAGYDAWVYERGGKIYGYGVVAVRAGEAHVLNICVHPDYHQQGCGGYIVRHLLKISGKRGANTVFLEVRPSNGPALRLYHKFGFNEIGTRKGYYPAHKGREDALLLALHLVD
ncbi:alanine acetyltransferase [Nitrosococcus oceani C-27]|nr:alanine acetyltransferase [Nitrosococcus oceani C-27]